MSSKPRRNQGVCLYCGFYGEITRDHIPPKSLFPNPLPKDLITVPACRSCNEGMSADDEYFRNAISMREDVASHPAIGDVLSRVISSFGRPKQTKFSSRFLSTISHKDRLTKSGIFIDQVPVMSADLDRINRVADRIIRGLYFHEFGVKVPSHLQVSSREISGFAGLSREELAPIIALIRETRHAPHHAVGGTIFCYRYVLFEEFPLSGFWVLRFYERVGFVCFVHPVDDGSSTTSPPKI